MLYPGDWLIKWDKFKMWPLIFRFHLINSSYSRWHMRCAKKVQFHNCKSFLIFPMLCTQQKRNEEDIYSALTIVRWRFEVIAVSFQIQRVLIILWASCSHANEFIWMAGFTSTKWLYLFRSSSVCACSDSFPQYRYLYHIWKETWNYHLSYNKQESCACPKSVKLLLLRKKRLNNSDEVCFYASLTAAPENVHENLSTSSS